VRKFTWIGPTIKIEQDDLVAKSNFCTNLVTLGSFGRKISVTPAKKVLYISYRRFWVFHKVRRIEFSWIAEINYRYASIFARNWSAGQTSDMFIVELKLRNEEIVPLFKFYGRGDFVNNSLFPDWCYWPGSKIAELNQTPQDSMSFMFATKLSGEIGVPVVSDII